MPRIDRIMVYPDPAALRWLNATTKGHVGGTLNLAIEAFADLIAHATVTNTGTFSRAEWNCILASGTMPEWHHLFVGVNVPVAQQLGIKVKVAHDRDRVGDAWFKGPAKATDLSITLLVSKLDKLTDVQGWAVVWSLRAYWGPPPHADPLKDEWWTLAFRTAKKGKG